MIAVALISRHTGPTMNLGSVGVTPGHVWPPPSIR